jgi:hypothetical protein
MLKNFIVFIVILLFFALLPAPRAEASEGVVSLKNMSGSNERCFAMSTLINRSTNYQLLIQCRNLIYPIEPEGTFYILWANPIGKNTKPIRIGDLEFGKRIFNVPNPFSSLFITKEQTQSPSQPSNDKVMEGSVESISFLEEKPTPTIIPSQTIETTPKITQKVTPTPQPKGGVTFSSVMLALGILIIIIFIFASIFYVVNKIRKS